MEFLEPWWSTAGQDDQFHADFLRQLKTEVAPGHAMHGVPAKLIARGDGDDCLFELMDGSGRVAVVHLTFSQRQEPLPWPGTTLFASLGEWHSQFMLPQHNEWLQRDEPEAADGP